MFSSLWNILEKSATDPEAGEIVCVLDALDECSEPAREDLITRLSVFYSARSKANIKLKFLATSRPYYDIERAFHCAIDDTSTINLKGEDESEQISKEINLVINDRVPSISRNRNFPLEPEVQNALIECLKSIPHRTYLWLHLVLDVIRKSLDSTRTRLERLINRIPRTVEDAYEKILTKIDDSESAEQARRLLHIVVAGTRPLNLQEMNIALAIDEKLERGDSCQSYDELDLDSEGPFRERIRNLCGLFVSIIDSKVYLIHQTAKEFLISKNDFNMSSTPATFNSGVWRQSLNPVESNLVLTKICLSYLLIRDCNDDIVNGLESLDIPQYQFLDYAAVNWSIHFRLARIGNDESILRPTLAICDSQSNHFSTWFQRYAPEPTRSPSPFSQLMIVSLLGLTVVVKLLLDKDGVELNSKDPEYGQMPLLLAAQNGHSKVVKLLLEKDGVELKSKDNAWDQTPLAWAAERGHSEVVKLLLKKDGVELNSKDKSNQTPLSWAVFDYLLKVYGDLDRKKTTYSIERALRDNAGWTPLSWAAREGHSEVVKLLLERNDVELNPKDDWGKTPLSMATRNGCSEVVRLLLQQDGIEVDPITAVKYRHFL